MKEIAERFVVSVAMVKKLIKQRNKLGHIKPLYQRVGRKRKITPQDDLRLIRLVEQKVDITLVELRDKLGVPCTIQTIFHALKRLGITHKKTLKADEQQKEEVQELRTQWIERMNLNSAVGSQNEGITTLNKPLFQLRSSSFFE